VKNFIYKKTDGWHELYDANTGKLVQMLPKSQIADGSKLKYVNQHSDGYENLKRQIEEIEKKTPQIDVIDCPAHWSESYEPPPGKKLVVLEKPIAHNGIYHNRGVFLVLDDETKQFDIQYSVTDFVGPRKGRLDGLRSRVKEMYRLWKENYHAVQRYIVSKVPTRKKKGQG
jgi:hypothetical protein